MSADFESIEVYPNSPSHDSLTGKMVRAFLMIRSRSRIYIIGIETVKAMKEKLEKEGIII